MAADNFAQSDVVSRHLLEERTDYFITQELKSQGREMHLGTCLDQIFEIALDPANFSNEKEQAPPELRGPFLEPPVGHHASPDH